jgi:hypothetical protein
MELLILILIVGGAIWFFTRSKKHSAPPPQNHIEVPIKVTISSGGFSTGSRKIDTGEIVNTEKGYILNPKSPLPLTIQGVDHSTAITLKSYLDEEANWGRKLWDIAHLFAETNATCKEIEEYIAKHRKPYFSALERLKAESNEWDNASDKDKEDMIAEFHQKALELFSITPNQNDTLDILLNSNGIDITADDKLLALFGKNVELYRFYVSQLWRAGKINVVPADDYYRKQYEALLEKKLAKRGQDIALEEIMNGLRLKDINDALKGIVDKPFGRKAKAIEYAVGVPDIKDRLGKNIAFREIFQICTPEGIDVQAIQKCYEHANAVASILRDTYVAGAHTIRTLDDSNDAKYDYWQIRVDDCCDECKANYGKRYKRRPTTLPPFHLGCNCSIEGGYDGI